MSFPGSDAPVSSLWAAPPARMANGRAGHTRWAGVSKTKNMSKNTGRDNATSTKVWPAWLNNLSPHRGLSTGHLHLSRKVPLDQTPTFVADCNQFAQATTQHPG